MPLPLLPIAGAIISSFLVSEAVEYAIKKFVLDKTRGLRDDVRAAALEMVRVFNEAGIPLVITEGLRSQRRQDELYAQGRTRPGKIVTWTRTSAHTEGRAFDVGIRGVNLDKIPRRFWYIVGGVGEALGLRWGGRWRVRDYVHFEAPT